MWMLCGWALAAPHVDVGGGYAGGAVYPIVLRAQDEELLIFGWGGGFAGRVGAGWLVDERFDATVSIDHVAIRGEGWTDGADVDAPGRLFRLSGHVRLPYWPAEPVRPYLILGGSVSHYGERLELGRLVPAADGGFGLERPGRVAPFIEADASWHVARYTIDSASLSFEATSYPLVPAYPAVRGIAGVRFTP